MPPVWPFKKRSLDTVIDETPPAPVVYKRGEDLHARPLSRPTAAPTRTPSLVCGGSSEVQAATDQSVRYDGAIASNEFVQPATEEQPLWPRRPFRPPTHGFITPMGTTTNGWRTVLSAHASSRTMGPTPVFVIEQARQGSNQPQSDQRLTTSTGGGDGALRG